MDLAKILSEVPQQIRGDRKFRLFRGREVNAAKIQAEFSRFIEQFPLERALHNANRFQLRDDKADAESLQSRLMEAVKQKTGFSFVRMGDGEGRFVGLARQFPHLYDQSKRIARDVWYRYSTPPDESMYDALEAAYTNASTIGYVPAYRLTLEAELTWYGYFGCVCGNEFISRHFDVGMPKDVQKLVRNWTNVLLAALPNFDQILRVGRTGIVTCHSNKDVFINRFGLANIEHIVIAPEAHPLLTNRSNCVQLYPEQFETIMSGFEKSDTQVYLVGAGIFAKIFCERLRQLGKVGIDMGSVLDQIAGIATRS